MLNVHYLVAHSAFYELLIDLLRTYFFVIQSLVSEKGKFAREQKALKSKAIRQREKDMKILWGELTSTKITAKKEPVKVKQELEKAQDVRYVYSFLGVL